jgi:hypothetical protein
MTAEAGFDPRILDDHAVPLIVIGGFAVAAHKVVRATRDLDIVTDRSWPAAERLAAALRSLDAEPASDRSIRWIPDVLVRPIDVRIDTRFGDLHLLNATEGIPPYSDMDHMTIVIDDLPIASRITGGASRDEA